MKEYDNGIKHEKSALENFAEKYVIDGKPKIIPFDYFAEKATQIKEFLRNHRNVKIRMIMVCIMEQKHIKKRKTIITQDKAYFNTETYIKVVIITCFLAQLQPYSPPIIPVISFVICHKIFPVYFLSFILYSFFQKSLKKYFL